MPHFYDELSQCNLAVVKLLFYKENNISQLKLRTLNTNVIVELGGGGAGHVLNLNLVLEYEIYYPHPHGASTWPIVPLLS